MGRTGIKLISLHEPWATLVALQFKRVETRDWATQYRGPLAIHASKVGMSLGDTLEQCLDPVFYNALMMYEPFRSKFIHFGCRPDAGAVDKRLMKAAFPNRGKIVAVVMLKACWPTETFDGRYPGVLTTTELAFGNYDHVDAESGRPRQGWLTEPLFTLTEPVPFTSKQGLVDVPPDVHAELQRQWRIANK